MLPLGQPRLTALQVGAQRGHLVLDRADLALGSAAGSLGLLGRYLRLAQDAGGVRLRPGTNLLGLSGGTGGNNNDDGTLDDPPSF